MKKINVIDLDNTLIPFDSFDLYIFRYIPIIKFFIILAIIILRKLRLIGPSRFKQLIITHYRKRKKYNEEMMLFAQYLYKKRNIEVMKLIESFRDENTITIIISASPKDYVQYFSNILDWHCIASDMHDKEYIHMYGKKKSEILKQKYNPSKFEYNFAISDHISDIELLRLFRSPYLISHNIIKRIAL